jgi:hypothetical protein
MHDGSIRHGDKAVQLKKSIWAKIKWRNMVAVLLFFYLSFKAARGKHLPLSAASAPSMTLIRRNGG